MEALLSVQMTETPKRKGLKPERNDSINRLPILRLSEMDVEEFRAGPVLNVARRCVTEFS